jgi:predicted nucleic acid-binding protein
LQNDITCNIINWVSFRYVLDTDVIVAALRSKQGASRQLLLAALNKRFELLLSVPLILEYEAVLTRAEHLAACGLSSAEVGRFWMILQQLRNQSKLSSAGG